MNKYEEELKKLYQARLKINGLCDAWLPYEVLRNSEEYGEYDVFAYIDTSVFEELVEKQNPMKPIKHICNEDKLTEAISFECSRCGKDVDDRFVGCPYCLGKLDWSEENE